MKAVAEDQNGRAIIRLDGDFVDLQTGKPMHDSFDYELTPKWQLVRGMSDFVWEAKPETQGGKR